ncbi:WD40-repeat-containing domain protein [Chaetomium fimeti]|uniref:WD40-repeat-containing domain protein n=1 Tax=Chaetomium fimeti TaxID=1854472 RepID=A0AAE0HQJ3_9PEZI|nr:WD40-repeat-containing domain protein [Chaetomium fimeti]
MAQQHSYALSPITALALYEAGPDHVLLAGEDTWLKVYDVQSSRLLGQLRVFYSQPIHGIHISQSGNDSQKETQLLIWGGHSVTLLPSSSLQALIAGKTPHPPTETHAPDWIYDGIILPASPSNPSAEVTGALVTAHNEILPFSTPRHNNDNDNDNTTTTTTTTTNSKPPPLTFGPLTSPSRPILYSANLALLAPSTLLVAGGTVFGEIIVWKYHVGAAAEANTTTTTNATDNARWEVLFVFTGHEGSVFGVSVSPDLGGGRRVLASCSDDRTVYSFGEDCSRQKWELDLDLERWSAVKSGAGGKNIWSAAVLRRGDDEPLVATGGADGKIVIAGKIKGVASGFGTYEDVDLSYTFDEVLRNLQGNTRLISKTQTAKNTKHAFQRYAFLSDTVMAVTASGRLFLATMGSSLTWEEVAVPETIVTDLKSYNVVKSPARDTAVLGSASGRVYLFRKGEVREIAILPEKISDIILLNAPKRAASELSWSVLVNILGSDHAILLHFDTSTDTTTIDNRRIRLAEHYIVTAAAFCDGTLILGSRTGSLTVYGTDPNTDDFIPLISRKDCKTKDSITCIVPIPGTPSGQPSFLATCRDGKYRIYTLSTSPSSPGLNLQHEISPPLNTLEAAFFTTPPPSQSHDSSSPEPKSELILHGFYGPNFLTYNDSTRSILSSIPCGGANRPFTTISCPHDPGRMRFVFSKAGTLRVVSQSAEAERVLRAGGHGREVKSVSATLLPSPSTPSPSHSPDQQPAEATTSALIATAAEDTSIRIWRHQPPATNNTTPTPTTTTEMTCLAIIQGHSAGIQALRFFTPQPPSPSPSPLPSTLESSSPTSQPTPSSSSAKETTYLLSSAGSEELFIWRLSRLASRTYDALAVVREAVWSDDHGQTTPDKDLRIMDFDVAGWNPGSGDGGEGGSNGGGMLVTMALSDSSVRGYVYSPPRDGGGGGGGGGGFGLLAVGRYTGACPTQVRYLKVDGSGGGAGEVHVLTAFTDGHVAVWRTTTTTTTTVAGDGAVGLFEMVLVVRVHQSSVKSLDLAAEGPGRWLVATGGDDNALGFLDLAWDAGKGGYVVVGRYRVKDAHAAAVTGLSVVKTGAGVTEVATASNDQRVKLWRAERSATKGMRVTMLDNRYSSVADAGDLELIAPGKLMVGGVGVEVWDVSRDSIVS